MVKRDNIPVVEKVVYADLLAKLFIMLTRRRRDLIPGRFDHLHSTSTHTRTRAPGQNHVPILLRLQLRRVQGEILRMEDAHGSRTDRQRQDAPLIIADVVGEFTGRTLMAGSVELETSVFDAPADAIADAEAGDFGPDGDDFARYVAAEDAREFGPEDP